MLLESKVAIVTGIGPGLGRDIALLFAQEGADLVIAARNAERVAVELGPDGIRANGIQVGPMVGDNFRGYLEDQARAAGRSYDEELAIWNEQFALRYTPTTQECAGTALFLASDLARPITGQSIAVNGGKWFLT